MTEGRKNALPNAIVIGIGRYKETDGSPRFLQETRACESAAYQFTSFLIKMFGYDEEEAHRRIRLLVTSNNGTSTRCNIDGTAESISVERKDPSENNIKALFEETVCKLEPDVPLIVYWCGHGALSQANGGQRRLFFSDTSENNWRNVRFDSLLGRIDGQDSSVRTAIMIVDACAVSTVDGFWPSGLIVGSRPRITNHLDYLAVFSTRRGGSADVQSESQLPVYTRLLLERLREAPIKTSNCLQTIRDAHNQVRQDFEKSLDELARDMGYGDHPELLPRQLPFEIVSRTPDRETRERPRFQSLVTDAPSAVEAARLWISDFTNYGPEFASNAAQRRLLKPFKESVWQIEGANKWWNSGWRRDLIQGRGTRLGLFAVILLLILLIALLWFRSSAAAVVGQLQTSDDVSARIRGKNALDRYFLKQQMRSIIGDARSQTDPELRRLDARHRANCAQGLLMLNDDDGFLNLIGNSQPWYDPQSRTYAVVNSVYPGGVPSRQLWDLLNSRYDSLSPRARQALILMLGQSQVMLSGDQSFPREEFKVVLLKQFEKDDDPGVHAACWWCLRRKFPDESTTSQLRRILHDVRAIGPKRLETSKGDRHWYIDTASGLTMVVLFAEGKPGYFGDRDRERGTGSRNVPHLFEYRLRRSFAIAMTEVNPEHLAGSEGSENSIAPAIVKIVQKTAAENCAALAQKQSSFELKMEGVHYRFLKARLPDELEWEYACRAGSLAKYSFGDDMGTNTQRLLNQYATRIPHSQTPPVLLSKMPNDYGLFDMHGGAAEWCANDDVPFPPDQELPNLNSSKAVYRGGDGYLSADPDDLTAFYRVPFSRDFDKHTTLGFRPVLTVERIVHIEAEH